MEQIVNQLKRYNKVIPQKALLEAIENQRKITPILLDELDKIIEKPEIVIADTEYILHLCAIYLLAQFREKMAFPKIIQLLALDPDVTDVLFGDTITEGLSSILYSTYDGHLELLRSIIDNSSVDEYVRGAALEVYLKLYLDGELDKETYINYLRKLIYDVPVGEYGDLDTAIEGVVIDSRLFEMIPDIEYLYDQKRIDEIIYGQFDDFIDTIYDYSNHGIKIHIIEDIMKEMEWWSCFERSKYSKKTLDFSELTGVLRNEKISRNDPCICGSGKKYKFCCINKDLDKEKSILLQEDKRQWLKYYPVIADHMKEGQVTISIVFDEESIEIDQLVYLALHRRSIRNWIELDRDIEEQKQIMYLTEAIEMFALKCEREHIRSFEQYDSRYKIHYRSKYWIETFEWLLKKQDFPLYQSTLKIIRKILRFYDHGYKHSIVNKNA